MYISPPYINTNIADTAAGPPLAPQLPTLYYITYLHIREYYRSEKERQYVVFIKGQQNSISVLRLTNYQAVQATAIPALQHELLFYVLGISYCEDDKLSFLLRSPEYSVVYM
jgi:hypothetical protein